MIVGAFSCVILCDGRPLEEYMADLKPGKGRAFIESVTGKEFSVQWTEDLSHPEAAHSSIGYVDFDGLVQTNRILHGGETEMIVTGQQVSSTREKPFVFSLITTSDRDEHRQATPLPDGFGTIELRIYRGEIGDRYATTTYDTDPFPRPILHERSVKGRRVTHRTAYAPEERHTQDGLIDWHFKKDDPKDKPYVTFTFVYRSRAMLQAQGVLPLALPAVPALHVKRQSDSITTDSDDTDDDAEVASALDRLAKARAAARKRAKQRRLNGDKKVELQNKENIRV